MNIAKTLAQYIKSKTSEGEVYYSSMPPGERAICVYEYDGKQKQEKLLPNIIPVTFKIVCRAADFDTCRECADDMMKLFKNAGNEMWGHKPIVAENLEFILISPRGTPDVKRESEIGNIRIALHFYAWVRTQKEAS